MNCMTDQMICFIEVYNSIVETIIMYTYENNFVSIYLDNIVHSLLLYLINS